MIKPIPQIPNGIIVLINEIPSELCSQEVVERELQQLHLSSEYNYRMDKALHHLQIQFPKLGNLIYEKRHILSSGGVVFRVWNSLHGLAVFYSYRLGEGRYAIVASYEADFEKQDWLIGISQEPFPDVFNGTFVFDFNRVELECSATQDDLNAVLGNFPDAKIWDGINYL